MLVWGPRWCEHATSRALGTHVFVGHALVWARKWGCAEERLCGACRGLQHPTWAMLTNSVVHEPNV
eukprot:358931-Chlamydomonas_euryale.AAC.2